MRHAAYNDAKAVESLCLAYYIFHAAPFGDITQSKDDTDMTIGAVKG